MFLWLMWQLIYGPPSDDIDQRRWTATNRIIIGATSGRRNSCFQRGDSKAARPVDCSRRRVQCCTCSAQDVVHCGRFPAWRTCDNPASHWTSTRPDSAERMFWKIRGGLCSGVAAAASGYSLFSSDGDTIAGSPFGPRWYSPSARALPGLRPGGSAGPAGRKPCWNQCVTSLPGRRQDAGTDRRHPAASFADPIPLQMSGPKSGSTGATRAAGWIGTLHSANSQASLIRLITDQPYY